MSSYILYLTASLLFYIAGLLLIVRSNHAAGVAFISLGCTFFAVALNRRKKHVSSRTVSPTISENTTDTLYEHLAAQLFRENDAELCSLFRRIRPSIEKLDKICLSKDSATALHQAISFKKCDTAVCLHQTGARLNPQEKSVGNEFVYAAPYLYDEGALNFAKYLLTASVSLSEKNSRSNATALLDICHDILTTQNFTPASVDFLLQCLKRADREAIFSQDQSGNSAWSFIHAYYPQNIIDTLESLHSAPEKESSKE